MKIEKHKVVALSYTLEVEGKIADQAGADRPLEYIQGTHMLIPRFEQEVEGLEPGGRFDFVLPPEEGYGTYDASRCKPLPKEVARSLLFMCDFHATKNASKQESSRKNSELI